MKMTRSQLEELVRDYIERSIELVGETLQRAKLTKGDINEIILVGGQTRMPAMQEAVKTYFGKEAHKDVNPDEVVAVGAAVQAGILQGEVRDVLLLDATPLSFGIETLGSVMTVMISKNTTVPTARSETFSTAADNQTSVEIHVLQGERPMAGDNKSLGRFILDGIPPSPRGIPQVEVTFDIDTNGILSVTAADKATNKKQSIRIEGSTGLSKDEIERLRKEAEIHLDEDKKKKETVETKNMADNLVYQGEKSLREWGDKVATEVKEKIQKAIDELKSAKDAGDSDKIKPAMEQLSVVLQEVGKNMYANQQQNPSSDQPTPEQDQNPENQQP